MPLHPEFEAMLNELAALGGPQLIDLPPSEGREMYRAMQPMDESIEVGAIANRSIDGPGGKIPLRIYTPSSPPEHGDLYPVFVYFHGGGWVIGDLDTSDSACRDVCNLANCVVVSVDYRLAPEHRYPAAADDCYAATCWVAEHATELGTDDSRLAVGGDSAGANLAAVVSQMSRDKAAPAIAFQLLIYPVTDAASDTLSYQENAEGYLLTAASMDWFWTHYIPEPENRFEPYASPARADDLSGLPPALVLTAEFDPLRDEGEAYAELLRQAGVSVEHVRYDGLIHGFFHMSRMLPSARPGMEKACAALKQAFYG